MFKNKPHYALRAIAIFGIAALCPLYAADRITGKTFATRSEVIAPKAMAATSQPLATQIALNIMRGGGNAIDAAIAANAALGLMEPTGNGIGGDLFAMVWDAKTKQLYGYNGSGPAPKLLSLKVFADMGLTSVPSFGPLPVTVPGAVDGWFALHKRFGSLPMADILAEPIRYAREGFPVSEVIAHYWALSVPRLKSYPGFSDQFTIDGKAPTKGQMWTNLNLANTYALLAKKGRDAFYKGDIARTMDRFFKRHEGYLRYEDLASFQGEWVSPISVNYRGYEVYELPPNGQGLAALQMLQMLERYDFSKIRFGSAKHIHLLVEAKKLAFADRARFYADRKFSETPIEQLLSEAYTTKRAALIGARAALAVEPGNPAMNEGDTIYLTTADAQGNMVSLIQSNFRGMGSGMAPDGLGFILQDRGEQFVLKPGHPNTLEGGKRPFHTIIPAFITKDGKPWLSFGLMGGAMQPQGHVQIVMNLIDFGMNLQEAGDAPRIQHEGSTEPAGQNLNMTDGGVVNLENGFSAEVHRALMRKGHVLQDADGPFGGYQAIMRGNGVWIGASESRKDGQAAGF